MSLEPEVEMSLSKYYKDSSSFQPEEILKQDEKTEEGWQSTSQQKSNHFEQSQLSTEIHLPESNSDEDVAENGPDEGTEDSIQQEDIPGPPEEAGDTNIEKIDLTQYIEISELEKQVEESYQKGVQDGLEKIDQDYDTATKTLLVICQQLDEIRNTIISNSSRELQDFALSIAERILRISVAEQDKTIIATIEEALTKAVRSDEFTIFIHPEDFKTVADKSANLIAEISGLNNLIFKKDITVERGGARIESENCTIDATISSQFETIRETIQKEM